MSGVRVKVDIRDLGLGSWSLAGARVVVGIRGFTGFGEAAEH